MTKDKMIYNDDQSIGVDEQSLNKFDLLFNQTCLMIVHQHLLIDHH